MYKLTITKKYGPIGTIVIKLMQSTVPDQQPIDQDQPDKIAMIKIKYLAPRNSWEMYVENCTTLSIDVEGSKLNSIFKTWYAVKSIYNSRKSNRIFRVPRQQP